MNRKRVIHYNQENYIECDNEQCDFVLKSKPPKKWGISYINKECPSCGCNLLTFKDWLSHKFVMGIIHTINFLFAWKFGCYPSEVDEKAFEINTHDGIVVNPKIPKSSTPTPEMPCKHEFVSTEYISQTYWSLFRLQQNRF